MNFSRTETKISFAATRTTATIRIMFSHIVVFWTDPANPNAADKLIAGMNEYLKSLPGVLHFHAGKMVPSHRPVSGSNLSGRAQSGFFKQTGTGRLSGSSPAH
jgi:hypothetical protein